MFESLLSTEQGTIWLERDIGGGGAGSDFPHLSLFHVDIPGIYIKTSLVIIFDCRLKPLDIEFMKRLHEKVNIIPLIAKADTLTPEECQQFKKQV